MGPRLTDADDCCLYVFALAWCIQHCFGDETEGRWDSEGVQIGGRGSAMGVIGLWTNAEYQPTEPLGARPTTSHYSNPGHSSRLSIGTVGPFWAWKVGPQDDSPSLAGSPGPSHGAD